MKPNKKEKKKRSYIVCIYSALFLFYGKSTYVCVLFNINLISAAPPPPPHVISGFAVDHVLRSHLLREEAAFIFFFSVRLRGKTRVRVIAKLEAIRPRPSIMQSDSSCCSRRRSSKERKLGPTYNKRFPPQNWVQACKKRGGKRSKNNAFFQSELARKRFSAPLNTGIRILYFRDKKEETAVNPEAENAQKFYFCASFLAFVRLLSFCLVSQSFAQFCRNVTLPSPAKRGEKKEKCTFKNREKGYDTSGCKILVFLLR